MKDISKGKMYHIALQFVKFGIVGLSNTMAYLLVYYVLIYLEIQYIIASTVGFLVSVYNAYILNKQFVFKPRDEISTTTFGKVILSYGFTYSISVFLLYFFVSVMLVSNLIAPILNLAITIPLNFILNKYWAFK